LHRRFPPFPTSQETTSGWQQPSTHSLLSLQPPHGSPPTPLPPDKCSTAAPISLLLRGPLRDLFCKEDGPSPDGPGFDRTTQSSRWTIHPTRSTRALQLAMWMVCAISTLANFRSGHIEIYDTNFKAVCRPHEPWGRASWVFLKKSFDDGESQRAKCPIQYPKYCAEACSCVRQAECCTP